MTPTSPGDAKRLPPFPEGGGRNDTLTFFFCDRWWLHRPRYRHKTQKRSFQCVYCLASTLHVVVAGGAIALLVVVL